jgi:type II secretory pathway component HofQ
MQQVISPSASRYRQRQEFVATLEQQAQQLQRDASGLQEQHDTLVVREALLHAWCEGVAALQRHCTPLRGAAAAGDGAQPGVAPDVHALQLQQLQDAEGSLLQQLRERHSPALNTAVPPAASHGGSTPGISGSLRAAGAACDAGTATMAPESDPCAIFLRAVAAPPPAEAYTITPQRLAQVVRDITLEMGVRLQQLDTASALLGPGGDARWQQQQQQQQQQLTLARLGQLWDM